MGLALVTGASKGIGKAIAEELASRKFDLLLIARSEELLAAVSKALKEKYGVRVDYLSLDLSVVGSPQRALSWCVQKNYSIDILVNNAGYGLSGLMDKYSLEENTNMIQVDVVALVQMCQLFLPHLKQKSKSYILNIASSAAYQAVPFLSIYSASKAFVLSFSRGLRKELKGSAVSVTCVSPGATDTEFVVRAQIGEKGLKTADRVNMKPDEVARLAVKATLAGKGELIVGLINKLGAFMVWLLPKDLVENTAMKIYQ
jgi:uncharacterized protein